LNKAHRPQLKFSGSTEVVMKEKQLKPIKTPLRVADFMCRRCKVQPTGSCDRICGICHALGQSVEPQTVSRQEYFLAAIPSKTIIKWLQSHHLFGLGELESPIPDTS
jgi:hypothetical protein